MLISDAPGEIIRTLISPEWRKILLQRRRWNEDSPRWQQMIAFSVNTETSARFQVQLRLFQMRRVIDGQ